MSRDDLSRERLSWTIDRETYTPAFLALIANALSWRGSALYMRHFGVGINEWKIISALGNHPGAMAAEVSTVLGLNKAVVSRCVRTLSDKGLVAVEVTDGRRGLYLTRAGVELHDRIMPVALEREAVLLSGFSDEEIVQLRRF